MVNQQTLGLLLDGDRVENTHLPEALPGGIGNQGGQGELVSLALHLFLLLGFQIIQETFGLARGQVLDDVSQFVQQAEPEVV